MSKYVAETKILLGIPNDDTEQDNVLEQIEKNTIALFKAKTGSESIPNDLSFIIIEVMIKRYNRLGAEGMTSTTRTDLTTNFCSSDFDEYEDILKARFNTASENIITPGRMMFL